MSMKLQKGYFGVDERRKKNKDINGRLVNTSKNYKADYGKPTNFKGEVRR